MDWINPKYIERYLEEFLKYENSLTYKQSRALTIYLKIVDSAITLEKEGTRLALGNDKHHVLPRAIYPEYENAASGESENFNLVYLTYKEHFICHHLLFEFYERVGEMACAWHRINHGDNPQNITCRQFSVMRDSHAKRVSITSTIAQKALVESGEHSWQNSENQKKNSEKSYSIEYSCPHCGRCAKGPAFKSQHFEHCKKNPDRVPPKKKTYKTRTCPHCMLEGSGPNMTRNHFDNCPSKPGYVKYEGSCINCKNSYRIGSPLTKHLDRCHRNLTEPV